MDVAVVENEQTGIALNNRIGALRELTRALLEQVESLGEVQPQAITRRNISLYDEVRRFETELIRCALLRTGGSQRRAARLLGIKATTLNAKIKRYNIQLDDPEREITDLRLVGR